MTQRNKSVGFMAIFGIRTLPDVARMSLKKTSFPKQDIRVLLLEGVSQTAVDALRAAGYSQIEYHAKALPEDELKARIAEAHIVGLRSRTQRLRFRPLGDALIQA